MNKKIVTKNELAERFSQIKEMKTDTIKAPIRQNDSFPQIVEKILEAYKDTFIRLKDE
jgi:hypothetical protein